MERYYENVMATNLEGVTDDIFKVTAKFQGDTIMERGDYLNTIFEDITAVTTGFDSMDIILKGVDKDCTISMVTNHLICHFLNLITRIFRSNRTSCKCQHLHIIEIITKSNDIWSLTPQLLTKMVKPKSLVYTFKDW